MRFLNLSFRSSIAPLLIYLGLFVFLTGSTANAIRIKDKARYRVGENRPASLWFVQGGLDAVIDNDEDYHGFQLSFGHVLTESSALRFNLGIYSLRPQFDDVLVFQRNESVYLFDDLGRFDVNGATFSLLGMFYNSPLPKPRVYFGLGPRLGIRDARPDVLVTTYDDFNYEWAEPVDYDDAGMVSFGIEGALGFEWFLGPQMSMFAEYGATIQNEWYSLAYDYDNSFGHRIRETEWFDDGIHFDDSHIKLGMSFYF